jgi:ferredoxin
MGECRALFAHCADSIKQTAQNTRSQILKSQEAKLPMNLSLTINHETKEIEIQPRETLLRALRRNGYFGVKHGCQ